MKIFVKSEVWIKQYNELKSFRLYGRFVKKGMVTAILENDGSLDYEEILKDIKNDFIPYFGQELISVEVITDIKVLIK